MVKAIPTQKKQTTTNHKWSRLARQQKQNRQKHINCQGYPNNKKKTIKHILIVNAIPSAKTKTTNQHELSRLRQQQKQNRQKHNDQGIPNTKNETSNKPQP